MTAGPADRAQRRLGRRRREPAPPLRGAPERRRRRRTRTRTSSRRRACSSPRVLGASFSLGLRGRPVSAGGGRITLRATSVRWWPGGRWTPIGSRLVELGLRKSAVVDKALASAVTSQDTRILASRAAPTSTPSSRDARRRPRPRCAASPARSWPAASPVRVGRSSRSRRRAATTTRPTRRTTASGRRPGSRSTRPQATTSSARTRHGRSRLRDRRAASRRRAATARRPWPRARGTRRSRTSVLRA